MNPIIVTAAVVCWAACAATVLGLLGIARSEARSLGYAGLADARTAGVNVQAGGPAAARLAIAFFVLFVAALTLTVHLFQF